MKIIQYISNFFLENCFITQPIFALLHKIYSRNFHLKFTRKFKGIISRVSDGWVGCSWLDFNLTCKSIIDRLDVEEISDSTFFFQKFN